MKKVIALCIVTIVVSSVTGCGCCRRLRGFICRGAYCGGSAVAAPAPIMQPLAVAPMACDPCGGFADYDPGCGYSAAYGSAPGYDSGWTQAGPACDSCSGGYSMPSYGDPNSSVIPGPAPIDGN